MKAPIKTITTALLASMMVTAALPASARTDAPRHDSVTSHKAAPQKQADEKPHIIAAAHRSNNQHDQIRKQPATKSHKASDKNRHPAPPKHWTKSNSAWNTHVDRCQKNYRSYNAKTDRYTMKGGKSAICRL
ncbi:MAG: hypothetical protein E2598_02390 [Sphingobium sp.]|nr:hypothetical protein [Sphingobium sp.]